MNQYEKWFRYIDEDVRNTLAIRDEIDRARPKVSYSDHYERNRFEKDAMAKKCFEIKRVVFNDPATIVFWADNTKTVVKCQEGDIYDPEKGLAMAIAKKALGNKGNYCEVFKKWLPKEKAKVETRTVVGQVLRFDQTGDGIYATIEANGTVDGNKFLEAIRNANTSAMTISFEGKKE